MSYKDDFGQASGWSAVDVNVRLSAKQAAFIDYLKKNTVSTVIRYYASDRTNEKTLTKEEAQFLSAQGLSLLPIFQDHGNDISRFSAAAGQNHAKSALKFAAAIGQPANMGSTILFAVDMNCSVREIDGPILDYFEAVQQTIGTAFAIGAYGSGAVLSKLLEEKLISIPWLSMSRAFLGTQAFFYSNKWALLQVPPEQKHAASKVGYDRNILRLSPSQLGAFTLDEKGKGSVVGNGALTLIPSLAVLNPFSVATSSTNRIVATDGLHLRNKPNGTILRELTLGEALQDKGESTVSGWRDVVIGSDKGVVFGKYLREPASTQVEVLIQAAIAEWRRFDKGKGDEKQAPFYRYVREMWAAIGQPYDGRSRDANGEDVPWSAAFISWVVRQAGKKYENFMFSASHSVFVNNAIKARYTQQENKPFWGYAINEQKPALGDIIQRNRQGNKFTFYYAENHASYNSHSDIVVEARDSVVRVMGGNVGNTVSFGVSLQEYELDSNGFIKDGQGVIALLKNRADKI
ncbi:TPA: DUF2272 domain-containing protein [Klebsiella variicola]|uniref:DUF2272 domain-containing protein n=1 Tax=Klebsiella variicola TaxID=244366 RepID=UPI000E2DACC7|nr:DUF2272 domain-containing protein [Klebsiella variicola]MCS5938522.1 DUF2272 domain-containing protein [Klebsiella variicola subsp. variicola]EIY5159239.1 DUF2272 domain-containing protein [Klebsiella variicola]NSM79459.1 DUF2272 domain-containing protein [Klebsiella variicola]NSM88533.1 DUF2272 domain-containing protein [Klebsiella variicola]VVK59778.1 Uncharacterized protein conserved in bacteria [Klebsiella variicola]